MANAAILWRDWLGQAVLTSSGTESALPLANVQDDQPAKVARLTGNSVWLAADFGVARQVAGVALAGTNLTPTATLRVRLGNDGSTWSVDSGIVDPLADPELNGLGAHLLASGGGAYRHLRLDIADAALAWIDLGCVLAGPVFRPTRNFSYGWQAGEEDLSAVAEGEGGQMYVAARPQRRRLALSFRAATEADVYDEVRAMMRHAGGRRNVYVEPRPGHAYAAQDRLFGLLRTVRLVEQPANRLYSHGFEIVERL